MKFRLFPLVVATSAFLLPAGQVLAQHDCEGPEFDDSWRWHTDSVPFPDLPDYYDHDCPINIEDNDLVQSLGGKRAGNPVVARVQTVLERQGFYQHAHHQIDGILGPETTDAIRNYQRKNEMAVTGQIDAILLSALNIARPLYGSTVASAGLTSAQPLPPPPADMLTPSEAAAFLRVSESEILSLLEKGQLAGRKIDEAWRISRDALTKFMEAQ